MKMKKYSSLTLLIFIALISLKSQSVVNIDANNINATINSNGSLFTKLSTNFAGFEVPRFSNSYAIYHSALCISAEDSAGAKYASGAFGVTDFTTGPLRVGTATTTPTVIAQYNKIWKLGSFEVSNHRNNYNNPGYSTPINILTWPAHGDTTQGYAYNLAPFIDVNQNGTYEPDSGDYPDIRGTSALFFIYNDAKVHSQTGGQAMGLEIHCMVYAIASNDPLNEAIFVNYKVINRSTRNYLNARMGQATDFDLGNPTDDYIETDVNRSMVFAKNGDNFDDNFAGMVGYGNLHAAVGLITLQGPLLDKDSVDNACGASQLKYEPNGLGFNDGIVDNERYGMSNSMSINSHANSIGGDFQLDAHLFNYMRSTWKNGRPQTFGANAYLSSGGTNCRNTFIENTDSTNYSTAGVPINSTWTENTSLNPPGDRRTVVSSGSFSFNSGEFQELSYAFVFARASVSSSVANSVVNLKSNADFVINYFRTATNTAQCNTLNVGLEELNESEFVKVYPNPSKGNFKIGARMNSEMILLNSLGSIVFQEKLVQGVNKIQLPSQLEGGLYFITNFRN